jgi:hypothetical protein
MRTRSTLITGIVFLGVAALLAVSQVSAGGGRLLVGLLIAAPWAASGLAVLARHRIGAWFGLAVACLSIVLAVWILSMANVGQGRAVAELLFASPEGYFTWASMFYTTIAYAIAFVFGFGLSLGLLLDARKVRKTTSTLSSDVIARRSKAALDGGHE